MAWAAGPVTHFRQGHSGVHAAAPRLARQRRVERPEPSRRQEGRRKEVDVGPTKATAEQAVPLDALERFLLRREHGLGQISQELKDGGPVTQVPARELSGDVGMPKHLAGRQRAGEFAGTRPEVTDPLRGVGKNHERRPPARRRRGCLSWRSEPPSAASRRAASRAMSASRPACTRAVFSEILVNSEALSTRSSRRMSVVLMHTNMHSLIAAVKYGDVGRRHPTGRGFRTVSRRDAHGR